MTRIVDVASVLLNTYKYHDIERLFMFIIFVSMFRPRSIYAISM